jgi:hypothetical protein
MSRVFCAGRNGPFASRLAPNLTASKCGNEPAREEAIRFGAVLRFKRSCLKDTCGYGLKATNSCAVAYSQARIRRLVRLGGGFYCGAVAECSVIGFSSSANFKAREYCHYVMAALRGALRCAGILEPGLLTRVKPPPLRLAAKAVGSISQGALP